MSALWLVGGTQGKVAGVADHDHARLYTRGVLARWVPGRAPEVVLTYRSPPEVTRGSAVGHVFKGIARDGDRWLVCTERELVWVDDGGRVTGRRDHPWFNDVHHAIRHAGQVHVAITGLDGVLSGSRWSGPPVEDGDWRLRDTRPHRVHPNHLFVHDGSVWATRFHERAAVCLSSGRRLAVGGDVGVHDGLVHDGRVWFTRVDGVIVGVDPSGGPPVIRRVPGDGPLGWCRGLAAVDGGWAVGFTQLRATRWRRNLAWVRGAVRGTQRATDLPTRVVLLRGAHVDVLQTAALGLDAVFGVATGP